MATKSNESGENDDYSLKKQSTDELSGGQSAASDDEDHRVVQGKSTDIEYVASLLNELKQIADSGGHKLLYHLIEMAAMEAEHISETKSAKNQE